MSTTCKSGQSALAGDRGREWNQGGRLTADLEEIIVVAGFSHYSELYNVRVYMSKEVRLGSLGALEQEREEEV